MNDLMICKGLYFNLQLGQLSGCNKVAGDNTLR